MRTVPLSAMESGSDSKLYQEIKEVFESASVVCFPSSSGYKLAADLTSLRAITQLFHLARAPGMARSLRVVWLGTIG